MALRAARGAHRLQAIAQAHGRGISSQSLPKLDYDYGALEPAISGTIMETHHSKHHQTYINGLNAALEKYAEAEQKGDLAGMIALEGALKFNGGGHVNHSLFWKNLVPAKDFQPPSGHIASAIDNDFGSVDDLKSKFNAAAAGIQGSGWQWLGYSKASGKLALASTANQDPLSTQGLTPLLGVDMWEHAYYLQYKNVKPDYLKNIWNVINWKAVGDRLESAR